MTAVPFSLIIYVRALNPKRSSLTCIGFKLFQRSNTPFLFKTDIDVSCQTLSIDFIFHILFYSVAVPKGIDPTVFHFRLRFY